jgi:hypothetical protein
MKKKKIRFLKKIKIKILGFYHHEKESKLEVSGSEAMVQNLVLGLPGSDHLAHCFPVKSEDLFVILLLNNSLIQQTFVADEVSDFQNVAISHAHKISTLLKFTLQWERQTTQK